MINAILWYIIVEEVMMKSTEISERRNEDGEKIACLSSRSCVESDRQ